MKNIMILCCLLIATAGTAQRNTFKNITEKKGMIGIGTKSPDELLTVKGKIHTQEVLVDLNGAVAPDYVFEHYFLGSSESKSDYNMLSLSEVASYIAANHHLPGVPSAKTIYEEGLSLKAMNLILLQKIEELTLYTLEQQNEIETLKQAVTNLQNK
ncbi:MAG: hypothetical protein KJO05_02800 [Bacteroidia bacterium]|nr:hypothetical protein [Bacteroidia bacterium]NNF32273.1 hypothetical protein [Flavobacteriaceae bacterium]MBT8276915.1 hypothetical protein [Bacteroidia bacterium]NNJ83304.1 hypothetical protein [Flavobacteriaceae bacterium]NNK53768.1 hypothetical protein [Flavobacteriaceae bacterium]